MEQTLLKKFSFCLPREMYEELQRVALQHKISVSDVIRRRILQGEEKGRDDNFSKQSLSILESIHQKLTERKEILPSQITSPINQNPDPLLLEVLFLLREFLFERNGQILRRVDEKLDQQLGKNRRKVL